MWQSFVLWSTTLNLEPGRIHLKHSVVKNLLNQEKQGTLRSCPQEGTRGLGAPRERIGRVFTGTPASPLQAQGQSMALPCPSVSSHPLCGSEDRAQGRGPKCRAKQEPGWCHQGRSGQGAGSWGWKALPTEGMALSSRAPRPAPC